LDRFKATRENLKQEFFMPHAGLMDERTLGPEAGPLQRARLHIRGGRRRLRQGKVAAGIVTLYDALLAAMEWYFASPERKSSLTIMDSDNQKDEKSQFEILVRSGVLDATFDYPEFDELVRRVLYDKMTDRDYQYEEMLKKFESVMTKLGVMPFDEKELPPEDPSTF
jgi:hypothetical protein